MTKELHDILAGFERAPNDEPLALATLVRVRGSSYRRPGARMLVTRDGLTIGSLSGGCLEDEVALRAQQVIASGQPVLLDFDTRLLYGCHGAIEIFVEKVRPDFLRAIADAQRARRSCIAATIFENADSLGSRIVPPEQIPARAFVQVIRPPSQLLVIGDGPENPALRNLAITLGWQLREMDEAALLPDELDEWTAAIVKTHNFGRDFAALQKLLPLGLPYVALLGSRRRRDQLQHALFEHSTLMRSALFAPAGLDLGAESPEQIALAIVTEIQATFAKASARSLRERKGSNHLLSDLAVA